MPGRTIVVVVCRREVQDNLFVLDHLPPSAGDGHQNVFVFVGGWAFKFVPLFGQILQELTITGSSHADISRFTITRPGILVDPKAPASDGEGRYSLVFRNLATEERVEVRADRIVLAMPRRSLELLDQRGFFFDPARNPELQTNIRASVMEPAFKLLMGFEAPWWRTTLKADGGYL
jgi:hypothetical protein